MSKKLLVEFMPLCKDGVCQDLLTEEEKKYVADGGIILSGIIQRADAQNGNGRIYPKKILEREVEKYQDLIRDKMALGSLDHIDSDIVELQNSSHLMTAVWWNKNDVYGKLRVLGTPTGEILKTLIREGVTLGISSRGLGSVHQTNNGIIVEDDFLLIAFDVVSSPSTVGAYLVKENKENKLFQLTKKQNITNILNSILKGKNNE